ncbi:MAG TPA: hypothetical protein VM101_07665 [Flavitalea sp.]|nr:hypothetical protein [Flavitalea sp.]
MKKLLYVLPFVAIAAAFSFSKISPNKNGAMFINDSKKAVLVLNIKDLIGNLQSASEQVVKFENGFLKNIQTDLVKEGYNITTGNKVKNQKEELTSFNIIITKKDKPFDTRIDIDKLMKNGQYTAIYIDKKTSEVMSMEASDIKF